MFIKMEQPNDFEGIDLVWLGIDQRGMIAAFVTAGCTFIPVEALNSCIIQFQDIEMTIHSLPTISDYELKISYPKMDDYIEIVKKGIFVYDWTDFDKSIFDQTHKYEIVAIPKNPIFVNDLNNKKLRSYLLNIRLTNADFTENRFIKIEKHL